MQDLIDGAKNLISMDCVDCRTKRAYNGRPSKFREPNVPPFRHNSTFLPLQNWVRLCIFIAGVTDFARNRVE